MCKLVQEHTVYSGNQKPKPILNLLREFSCFCTVARFHCEQVNMNHESIIEGEEITADLFQRSEERTRFVFAIEQKKTNKLPENSLASVSCL